MFANCDNLSWWGKTTRLSQHKRWTDIFQADGPAETRTDDLIILLVKEMMRNVTQNAKMNMVLWAQVPHCECAELQCLEWSWFNRKKLKKWEVKEREPEEVKRQTWWTDGGVEGLKRMRGDSHSPFSAAGLQTSAAASKITEITWKQAWGRADYTNNPPQHLFSAVFVTAWQFHNGKVFRFNF